MKRKFKKFLYLVFSFLLIINFQNKSFADEYLDKLKDKNYACNLFYKKVFWRENNLNIKIFLMYNEKINLCMVNVVASLGNVRTSSIR